MKSSGPTNFSVRAGTLFLNTLLVGHMRYFICFLLLTAALFAKQGNLVYSFEKGKIQLITESTPDGRIVGLLKPLKANTSIESVKIDDTQQTISFLMIVQQEKPICAGWTDIQSVTIKLDPKPVSHISLGGKILKTSEKVTILGPA